VRHGYIFSFLEMEVGGRRSAMDGYGGADDSDTPWLSADAEGFEVGCFEQVASGQTFGVDADAWSFGDTADGEWFMNFDVGF
jgi:hypothetical protein